MPIDKSDIKVGGIYATPNNQERRVTQIDEDGRVHYESRGGNVKNPWEPGHTRANPPTMDTFADACDRILHLP